MIYADNAATTRPDGRVCELTARLMSSLYGNPSSLHSFGRDAAEELETARSRLASLIHCQPKEVIFTSGGTEADNWAIRGILKDGKKRHVIASPLEHPAVLNTLADCGCEVSFLKTDGRGYVDSDSLRPLLRSDTALVTVMTANNELGTVQPIRELASLAAGEGIPFHTDAVQAVGHLPIDFRGDGITLLSLSGHKFNAPKGVGALIVRENFPLPSFITGGGQESDRRAGTENVPSLCGMGLAAEIAQTEWEKSTAGVASLREFLRGTLSSRIDGVKFHTPEDNVLPGILNLSFDGVEGEALMLLLDIKGICVSTGSACLTGKRETSHVLKAIGLPEEEIRGAIRISLDRFNTKEEIATLADLLSESVSALRRLKNN